MTYNAPELLLVGAAKHLVLSETMPKFRSGEAYEWIDSDPVIPYSLTLLEDSW